MEIPMPGKLGIYSVIRKLTLHAESIDSAALFHNILNAFVSKIFH